MNKIEFENGSQIGNIINKIVSDNISIETIEKELNNYGIKIRDEQGKTHMIYLKN